MALEIDRVREIAERVASSSGLEVVELEFRGGGKARMLRVFLDKVGAQSADPQAGVAQAGVTHEDCANFSREFGTILDVEDAVPGGSYTLEVSSPGLDRRLNKAADFERFVGSRVKLMTREPVHDNRFFEGRLESFRDGRLTLDLSVASKKSRKKMGAAGAEQHKMEIEFANVEKANLVPEI
ncbi:MAG TPA: ribosome maturation factor RimP [Candidatus Sulfotelmatobacter sp.]|nr:ribosome maturation factor RimP [Candidatus Sulfotelmatobacter sp.]